MLYILVTVSKKKNKTAVIVLISDMDKALFSLPVQKETAIVAALLLASAWYLTFKFYVEGFLCDGQGTVR